MATQCEDITCPELCNDVIPAPKFKLCNPDFLFGQISDIYITNVGNPLSDETSAIEWAARLALNDNNPAKIFRLVVTAEKPDPEVPEAPASHGRKAYGFKNHVINGTIDEMSDENYNFMRAMQCGKTLTIWYKLLNGKAYGGPAGVDASIKIGHVIPQSAQELVNLPFSFYWTSQDFPCTFEHPLQGDDTDLES